MSTHGQKSCRAEGRVTSGRIDSARIPAELRPALQAIAAVAARLALILRQGSGLGIAPGPAEDRGGQTASDMAEGLFRDALAGCGMRWFAAQHQAEMLDPEGAFAIAVSGLGGNRGGVSNIDINAPLGSIFSIYAAEATAMASFLRPARQQIASGYIHHGPRCEMMLTFGDGVQHYALDPDSDRFRLLTMRQIMPPSSDEFAIDASNYRHWTRPIRDYVDDCLAATEGPRQTNSSLRWTGNLVAEAHRILIRGGIFLEPADSRQGRAQGRLRLLYDCAPLAFLIEQAGGRATDARAPILDQHGKSLQQRMPLVFGSARMVARVAAYHDLPDTEVSALFSHRGLFRG